MKTKNYKALWRKAAKRRKGAIGALLFLIVGLVVVVIWSSGPRTPELPKPPLKELASSKHSIEIGNYAALRRINEPPYSNILTSQYQFVTDDGELNWTYNDGSLRPAPDKFDFTNSDKVMAFAKAHNMPVQAHHLIWGEDKWLPGWLTNGNYTSQQSLQALDFHIKGVMDHYRGQVMEWTVVNEAFTRGLHENGLRDWWADHTGGQEYIDQAFFDAHQEDPNAKLILNDFDNEIQNSISNAMFEYVKSAKQRGVPIDGVGMQMHIDGQHPPKKEDVITNMQRFGNLGVKIYVTEFDVNMNNVPGSDEEREQIQAGIYYEMARACIESKVCPSFAELGITDKETWYNELGWVRSKPLPFDNDYHAKPAFYALRAAFSQN